MTKSTVPYSNVGTNLLNCIYKALAICVEKYHKKLQLKPIDKDLVACFSDCLMMIPRGIDVHITNGNTEKEKFELRINKIIIRSFQEAQLDSKQSTGYSLPSPLYILNQLLTVPEEPQSAAYSLVFCRTVLYETFQVFPEHNLIPTKFNSFNISDIQKSLLTFNSYIKKGDNIPHSESNPHQLMLAHYLAMKGVFYLRFGTLNKKSVSKDKHHLLALKYLESKNLKGANDQKKSVEFHKSSFYEQLPDTATLVNELFGIPLPVRGAETILQGGLKTDSNSNLVVRVSGEPGSGKTSFALALAAVMSPFNTFTYYMSLEENTNDLKNRLHSLIPGYLKKLSFYDDQIDNWFHPDKIAIGESNRLDYFETFYFDKMASHLNRNMRHLSENALPSVCPIIIVIDSVRVLLNEKGANLDRFIDKCKRLNAIVILLSANDEKFHGEIDYLVDLVIHLKHEGTNSNADKPVRILQLSKTRHQISRPGAHIFHLSGEKGVRISPQLPSQIDRREKIKKPIPSKSYYSNFFSDFNNKKTKSDELKIWDKSQILIQGNGSSGKAGLALNLLLSPIKEVNNRNKEEIIDYSLLFNRRKVLIISLLYPEEYYKGLRKPSKILKPSPTALSPIFHCIDFYSGYLTPEDFISRILRKLDQAILEGEPYTGILLDGLHNVSLQFKKLQESDMVWATLYNLLAKYKLTIVTTFTNFTIEDRISDEVSSNISQDYTIMLSGQKPLLHALVQGTDYYLQVKRASEPRYLGKYIVYLRSAIRHKFKNDKFIWDREASVLDEYYSLGKQS